VAERYEAEVILETDTRFKAEWVHNNYLSDLEFLWKQQDAEIQKVIIRVPSKGK